ncbi:carboxylating nicotinate-nucleotide diphosphorylase [Thiohalophilus thiocyanatoxydans]|uniref:Probable nicotinate-nucleotide pyrophosphorylase [carboxylating] n=1 Tax=Thiohalophilus thiocyanatoxydans TaxID=381308 RepID=A0A4R8IE88_9GAMM|nr:carboxylating nicotinate-nucleotide diphosphorylase [Thiohalophilus thiocyanatoxydans]TDX97910.1 nicotinate-nucleotide pyrophosphorylase [carboxylating] [Thiohalophilus thiocyanatoxydans]
MLFTVPPELIQQQVSLALAEDVGSGDVTAALLPETRQANARIICRQSAVIAGHAWFDEVFRQLDPATRIDWQISDGDRVEADQLLCELRGPVRSLLTGERTALNFLQLLSGTATSVRHYVDQVADTGARILDTRKTLPGLRLAQKYAVSCGGGTNHRIGLYDMVLIKENHIAAAGSILKAVDTARGLSPQLEVEVEVETLEQLEQALEAGVERVLLDNMSLKTLGQAVSLNSGRAILEASGGITLENIREVAQTGVDFISVGALTKDVQAVDLSLRIKED